MPNDPKTHLIGCPFRDGDANPCLCSEPEKHREGAGEVNAICGATRGHYGHPWRITGTRGIRQWTTEHYKPVCPPKRVKCEHPDHHGRRLIFPLAVCYVQHWKMSKREFAEATDAWDIMSLDMPGRILCPDCARRERVK